MNLPDPKTIAVFAFDVFSSLATILYKIIKKNIEKTNKNTKTHYKLGHFFLNLIKNFHFKLNFIEKYF